MQFVKNIGLNIGIVVLTFFSAAASAESRQDFFVRSGPATAWIIFGQHGSQFSLSYNGYLYSCGTGPYYQGTQVRAHVIFHRHNQTKIFLYDMAASCSTPSNYNAPTQAQLTAYTPFEDGEPETELWQWLRASTLSEEVILEVAFESAGHWDSDFGRNYQLDWH